MSVRNHPLVGQRLRLTGYSWVNDTTAGGKTFLIERADPDGTVLFDLNEHGDIRERGRHVGAWAWITESDHRFAAEVVRTIYGSRPRNVDPLPYVDRHTDTAGHGRRFAEPYHLDGQGTDCSRCVTRYEPRPAFDPAPIHPVNPILAAFRGRLKYQRDVSRIATTSSLAGVWLRDVPGYSGDVGATVEHIEHARRVIERLARL